MSDPKIIAPAEAQEMLDGTTPGPWMRDGLYVRTSPHEVAHMRALDDEGGTCGEKQARPNAALCAAAPDLAATVAAEPARIAAAVAAERAAIVEMLKKSAAEYRAAARNARHEEDRAACREGIAALESAAHDIVKRGAR